MIREAFVSFDTAKLLKEKGLPQDLDIDTFYDKSGNLQFIQCAWTLQEDIDKQTEAIAPTQALAMRWIREEFNFHITVDCIDSLEHEYVFSVNVVDMKTFREYLLDTENTYEIGCEEGIKYVLEKLI